MASHMSETPPSAIPSPGGVFLFPRESRAQAGQVRNAHLQADRLSNSHILR
jgi:hypothetical protein